MREQFNIKAKQVGKTHELTQKYGMKVLPVMKPRDEEQRKYWEQKAEELCRADMKNANSQAIKNVDSLPIKYKFNRVGYDYVCELLKNVIITISGAENFSYAKVIEERLNISQGKLEEYYRVDSIIQALEREIACLQEQIKIR